MEAGLIARSEAAQKLGMTVSGIRKLEDRRLTVHRDDRGRVFYERSQIDAILAGAFEEDDEEERRSRCRAESLEVDRQFAQYQAQYDAEALGRQERHKAAMEALRARSEQETAARAARLTARALSARWAVSLDELGALARLRLIVPADGLNSLLAQVCGWTRAIENKEYDLAAVVEVEAEAARIVAHLGELPDPMRDAVLAEGGEVMATLVKVWLRAP